MSAASDYLENKIIDAVFRGQALPSWTTLWVGLCTEAPTDSSFGTEVTGSGYARVGVTSSLTNWDSTQGDTDASTGTSGKTANTNAIEFPTPQGQWGSVSHWLIADSSTSGNLLVYGALNSTKEVETSADVVFVAGALQVTLK